MKISKYKMTLKEDVINIIDEEGNNLTPAQLIYQYNTSVFALHGDLGAGKTTLIKNICQELEVEDVVNSPTFAIVNSYTTKKGEPIYHFDCYRLKNIQEAMDIGTEEYLYSGDLCFIEWPEVIENLLPENTVTVTIKSLPQYRELTIQENN